MDPAIVFFGFGVGFLVGLTGMGGGSLMTPLLILIFGIKPTTAIGTDIFYAAITKTAGGWRHLKLKTVNLPLTWWMAAGSVPSAIAGVWFLDYLEGRLGNDLDGTVFAILAGCLLVVGAITLLRSLFLADKFEERDSFEMHTRHKVAAVGIGATTGFVIVFHAAILLWAAGIAHIFTGNVDFGLAGNILVGSVPGVVLGSNMSVKWPQGILRTALGIVLIAAGVAILNKANTDLVPYTIGFAAVSFIGLFAVQFLLRREVEQDPAEQEWLRTAAVVASHGDEIERHEQVEAELAARANGQGRGAGAGVED
jgi:uncharacterized membrane protein YfcA